MKEEIEHLKIIEDLKEQVAFLEQGKLSIVFWESKDSQTGFNKELSCAIFTFKGINEEEMQLHINIPWLTLIAEIN